MKISTLLGLVALSSFGTAIALGQKGGGSTPPIFIDRAGPVQILVDAVSTTGNSTKFFEITVRDWDLAEDVQGNQFSALDTFSSFAGTWPSYYNGGIAGVSIQIVEALPSDPMELKMKFKIITTNAAAQTFDYIWSSTDLSQSPLNDAVKYESQSFTITQ